VKFKSESVKSLAKAIMTRQHLIEFLKTAQFMFEIDFSFKLLPNRNGHLYAVLFRDLGDDEPIDLDERDMETLFAQWKERLAGVKLTYRVVRYDGKLYNCVYVDLEETS